MNASDSQFPIHSLSQNLRKALCRFLLSLEAYSRKLPDTGCFTNNVTNSKRNISRNNACISTKFSLYNRKIIPNNILNS